MINSRKFVEIFYLKLNKQFNEAKNKDIMIINI